MIPSSRYPGKFLTGGELFVWDGLHKAVVVANITHIMRDHFCALALDFGQENDSDKHSLQSKIIENHT
jgi:hypothetical protein